MLYFFVKRVPFVGVIAGALLLFLGVRHHAIPLEVIGVFVAAVSGFQAVRRARGKR